MNELFPLSSAGSSSYHSLPYLRNVKMTTVLSEKSEICLTLGAVLAQLNEEGNCPRFNYIYLLSQEAMEILHHMLDVDVNLWGEDALRVTILGLHFSIPEVLTCRGTLEFAGFNPTQVEELWDFLKESDPRGPRLAPVDEFRKRMIEYIDDRIDTIHLRDEDGKLISPADLFDALGLSYDAQSHLLELLSVPGPGGAAHRLRRTHPDYVLALAKQYVLHRFRFLCDLDDLVVFQQEGWEEEVVKGFTQMPIMSIQATAALDVDSLLLPNM